MSVKKKPFNIKDEETKGAVNHLFDNAMGTPIVFDSEPGSNTLAPNTWGIYNEYLYIKLGNGQTLKFTGTVLS